MRYIITFLLIVFSFICNGQTKKISQFPRSSDTVLSPYTWVLGTHQNPDLTWHDSLYNVFTSVSTPLIDTITFIIYDTVAFTPYIIDVVHAFTISPGRMGKCNNTTGSFAVTLPDSPPTKSVCGIKMTVQSGANYNVLQCGPNSWFNVHGGATTDTLKVLGEAVTAQYRQADSTWTIMNNDLPLKQTDLRYFPIAGHSSGELFSGTATNITSIPIGTAGQVAVVNSGKLKWVTLSGRGSIDSNGVLSVTSNFNINAQVGTTYTLALTDTATFITATNSSAETYTVPKNASIAFPVGSKTMVINTGTGLLTFLADSGVTLKTANSDTNLNLLPGQSCYLFKTATNTWWISGGNSN